MKRTRRRGLAMRGTTKGTEIGMRKEEGKRGKTAWVEEEEVEEMEEAATAAEEEEEGLEKPWIGTETVSHDKITAARVGFVRMLDTSPDWRPSMRRRCEHGRCLPVLACSSTPLLVTHLLQCSHDIPSARPQHFFQAALGAAGEYLC